VRTTGSYVDREIKSPPAVSRFVQRNGELANVPAERNPRREKRPSLFIVVRPSSFFISLPRDAVALIEKLAELIKTPHPDRPAHIITLIQSLSVLLRVSPFLPFSPSLAFFSSLILLPRPQWRREAESQRSIARRVSFPCQPRARHPRDFFAVYRREINWWLTAAAKLMVCRECERFLRYYGRKRASPYDAATGRFSARDMRLNELNTKERRSYLRRS